MNNVSHLIISNTIDFSTDLVCLELKNRQESYLRINRDKFEHYQIVYDLQNNQIILTSEDSTYLIDDKILKSVFFRAPVFLRSGKTYTVEEQLYRSQWSAFIRNLIVFEDCNWINNPVHTYKAENKMYQLKLANNIGLMTPISFVCNHVDNKLVSDDTEYIVKALDTALFHDGDIELFTYSTIVNGSELKKSNLSSAPIFIQQYLKDKVDIRVTVIGNKLFPVKITQNGAGISEDWRKTPKELLSYDSFELPLDISTKIMELMSKLKLQFGGVDLIYCNEEYYFIEVNPTGEWGWLKFSTETSLEKEIVDCMTQSL